MLRNECVSNDTLACKTNFFWFSFTQWFYLYFCFEFPISSVLSCNITIKVKRKCQKISEINFLKPIQVNVKLWNSSNFETLYDLLKYLGELWQISKIFHRFSWGSLSDLISFGITHLYDFCSWAHWMPPISTFVKECYCMDHKKYKPSGGFTPQKGANPHYQAGDFWKKV